MFAPGVPNVMEDFKSDNVYLASFVVSVYLLGYCFGPLVIAPLSELYGRMPLYNICNVLFTVFNVACAVAPNMSSLIIFRLFAGLAGSCPLTIGAGSLSDMIRQEKRGGAMAAWALGPLLGPVVGPVGKYIHFFFFEFPLLTIYSSGWISDAGQRLAMDFLGVGNSGMFDHP